MLWCCNQTRYRDKHPELLVDEHCVRFDDAYPKVCRQNHETVACFLSRGATVTSHFHCLQHVQAKHHALVVARDPRLDGPQDLRSRDVPLLQHMQVPCCPAQPALPACTLVAACLWRCWTRADAVYAQEVGQHWIDDVHSREPGAVFRMGFHAVPSMTRLHLHVISQVRGNCSTILIPDTAGR